MITFSDIGIREEVLEALEAMNIVIPTPVQEQAIPLILAEQDVLGCAQTGTGKTAAFVIPLLQRITANKQPGIQCIILAPTRELAQQIDQHVMGLGYFLDVGSVAVYGGNQPALFDIQKKAISAGTDIIVATPGRLIQHINLGYVQLSTIRYLVLDEADRMLDMGFYEDIMKIIGALPKKRQNLMFSATMPKGIRTLAGDILNNYKSVNIAIAKPAEGIHQSAYLVYERNKIKLLLNLLDQWTKSDKDFNMIIFAARKSRVDDIANALKRAGIPAKAMHSGKGQDERNEIMRLFKAGRYKILIATDILSRGIDIDALSYVINFDIPDEAADYVHRVGRTARADKQGAAISFINQEDVIKFKSIERLIEKEINKADTPAGIGETPEYKVAPGRKEFGRRGHSNSSKSRRHKQGQRHGRKK